MRHCADNNKRPNAAYTLVSLPTPQPKSPGDIASSASIKGGQDTCKKKNAKNGEVRIAMTSFPFNHATDTSVRNSMVGKGEKESCTQTTSKYCIVEQKRQKQWGEEGNGVIAK